VLPLTTAVTHVVLLRVGELQIGVPSNLVDSVQRARPRTCRRPTTAAA
jgi:chemosensory pili system protein ChpA (sensor histidine kinase/response regulator)